MGYVCRSLLWFVALVAFPFATDAQITPRAPAGPPAFAFEQHARKARPLQPATGFLDHVAGGKLILSLDDAVRLALANNTDIRVAEQPVETATNAVETALAPFDPNFLASFRSTRQHQPAYSQLLGGPPTLNSSDQTTSVGVTETFETGTVFDANFNSDKSTSNSDFYFFSPAFFTTMQFGFTQPLLKGRGLFVNRAPIVVAQRGLAQSRSSFEGKVNDILLKVIQDYWNVIQAQENLSVQRESLDEAQKSYDHDKRSLELGALPPLDIYRSESQVASRRVSEIQAEYFLKQQQDQLRRDLGADLDPNIRALDLNLTDTPDPSGVLMSIDIPAALQKSLQYRPEIESMCEQLASDDINVRVAHNGLEPDLSLTGTYTTSGLNTNIVNGNFSAGTYGSAINQMFGFGYPTYEFGITLKYPFRNHQAQAAMGNALASKRADLYSDRLLHEQITLDVTNAVHALEESKLSMQASKVALDLAHKTLQADQHKYELGAETVFFVLEAQTELTQAQMTLVQAEVNYQLATAQVDHDTGGLLRRFEVQLANLTD